MLYTTCTDCRTSYKITVDELHQADGQVRCGRCRTIFSAFDELTDCPPQAAAEVRSRSAAEAGADSDEARAESVDEDYADYDDEDHDDTLDGADEPSEAEWEPATDEVLEDAELDSEQLAASESREDISDLEFQRESLSAGLGVEELGDTDAVTEPGHEIAPLPSPWMLASESEPDSKRRGYWPLAALLAAFLLGGQAIHHYREQLAQIPFLGSALQDLYATLGSPLPVGWDPEQIDIVNWETTTAPSSDTQNRLRFTAGIVNRGRSAQPMPLVYLKLTDRWEQPIGSRYFSPNEYLVNATPASGMLEPDSIADIRLELLDPGPGAYGFEVDVCVEVTDDVLRCKSDRVFE